jgi:hypothetical protein
MEWFREISGLLGLSLYLVIILQLHKFIKELNYQNRNPSEDFGGKWAKKLTYLITLSILAALLTLLSISLGYNV